MKNRIIATLMMLVLGVLLLAPPLAVSAQDELSLTTDYPKIEGTSGDSFEFEIKVSYNGDAARLFDINVTGPQFWTLAVSPSYPKDKIIQNIRIEPSAAISETLVIQVSTPYWLVTEPGDYDITLELSSEDGLSQSITVQAVITARYAIAVTPPNNIYSTEGQAGKDTSYTLNVENTGTATLNNIRFSSDKPNGWNVDFSPSTIESLEPDASVLVDVTLTPPEKAISGDYMITLSTQSQQVFGSNVKVRVSVETRAVWGWVGVIIIVLVVIALGYFIMRFSRR